MTCNKIVFHSSKEAHTYLKVIHARRGKIKSKGRLRVYKCDRCPKWHLTSISRNEQKRIERTRNPDKHSGRMFYAYEWKERESKETNAD